MYLGDVEHSVVMDLSAIWKRSCQTWLRRVGLYERVKGSWLYDTYWRIADPPRVEERRRELLFYRETLVGFRANDLIFDIGANEGLKTEIFLKLGARIVAVDPDAANLKTLTQRFLTLRFRKRPIVVVAKAVSDRNGSASFWIKAPGFEMNTLSGKWVEALEKNPSRFGRLFEFTEKKEVETITLEELIRSFGRPFYIKIDVEGYELNVLKGLETIVPYVSFEVNLPEFRVEGQQCIARLHELAEGGVFNYSAGSNGMKLQEWVCRDRFTEIFQSIRETSVEVFWRTSGLRLTSAG